MQHSKWCEGWEEPIGKVIKEPIGKGLFVHHGVPMGTQIFATNGAKMVSQGEHITPQEATLRYGKYNNPYSIQVTDRVIKPRTRRLGTRKIPDTPILESALI